jgi:hypothetical protein
MLTRGGKGSEMGTDQTPAEADLGGEPGPAASRRLRSRVASQLRRVPVPVAALGSIVVIMLVVGGIIYAANSPASPAPRATPSLVAGTPTPPTTELPTGSAASSADVPSLPLLRTSGPSVCFTSGWIEGQTEELIEAATETPSEAPTGTPSIVPTQRPTVTPTRTAAPHTGSFSPTGAMRTARSSHTATLLPSGSILIAGGQSAAGVLASAELYDPKTGRFSPTGSMTTARFGHTATLVGGGLVLIAGGYDVHEHPLASAEVYHPETGTFSDTGSMSLARVGYAASSLQNGCALIVGGSDYYNYDREYASAELYDPKSGTFVPTGSLRRARHDHTATLLGDGRVLVAGGGRGVEGLTSAEIYDPLTGLFGPTGSMMQSRNGQSATLLRDGRVLVAGGLSEPAELYDPKTGKFTPTGRMVALRSRPTGTLLRDGRVLLVGTWCWYQCGMPETPVGELYDPATGAFSPTVFAAATLSNHTATLLPGGPVLIAGGTECRGTGQCSFARSTLWIPD